MKAQLTACLVACLALTACGTSTSSNPTPTTSTPPAPTSAAPTSRAVTAPPTAPVIPQGKAGRPRGLVAAPKPATSDANAVADAALATMFSYDTRLDTAPRDATQRASAWLAPALVERPNGSRGYGTPGGKDWTDLAAHDGYTTVVVTPDTESEVEKPGPLEASVLRTVKVTQHGTKGWVGKTDLMRIGCRLSRPSRSSAWRIDDVVIA